LTAAGPDQRLHWYGRRRGHKLRPGRQALIDGLLPRLRIVPPAGGMIDLATLFGGPCRDFWLEVGFGSGEHLATQAAGHPDVGLIGCEPFVNGIAALLSQIERDGLTNVRVYDDDARRLFPALPESSLGRVFALFSDPWPKKRHHRRRFIGPETLDQLARVMQDGAELRLASDHMDYVRWALWHVTQHADFAWPARGRRDWAEPPQDWVETRYERKAKKQGARPVYLRFLRRPRAPFRAGKNVESR
jgi:tRNA (guanine-N7-)-methyltransferase